MQALSFRQSIFSSFSFLLLSSLLFSSLLFFLLFFLIFSFLLFSTLLFSYLFSYFLISYRLLFVFSLLSTFSRFWDEQCGTIRCYDFSLICLHFQLVDLQETYTAFVLHNQAFDHLAFYIPVRKIKNKITPRIRNLVSRIWSCRFVEIFRYQYLHYLLFCFLIS